MSLVSISRRLCREVDALDFGEPVTVTYNPLAYARAPHEKYLKTWGSGAKEAIFLGMNPGPFGMAQTGVPFGDVSLVRDFLGITGKVERPAVTHDKRPVEGFDCARSEVSGSRLWGWVRDRFVTPAAFFERFFVVNYCPLVFMAESGKNLTPDQLGRAETEALFLACDRALAETVKLLGARWVIGVGAFAEKRARSALQGQPEVRVGTILHPSPASPVANRGWAPQAERQLQALGVL